MRPAIALTLLATAVFLSHPSTASAACAPSLVSVTYFVGQALSGSPADESCRPLGNGTVQISDDWGLGGPRLCVRDCPGKADDPSKSPPPPVYQNYTDNFSVRYQISPTFQNGVYIFTVNSDDGVRLRIDGQLAIDDWSIHAARVQTVERFLTAGPHQIVVEYFEAAERAMVQVGWRLR